MICGESRNSARKKDLCHVLLNNAEKRGNIPAYLCFPWRAFALGLMLLRTGCGIVVAVSLVHVRANASRIKRDLLMRMILPREKARNSGEK